jgi:HEAT repeat protein
LARLDRFGNWFIGTTHSILGAAAACALALVLVATAAQAQPPSIVLDVSVSGGVLTVDARNAPLAEVLQTIGQAAGIEVTLRGDFSAPITASLTGVSLEEGLRRLASGHSIALTYAAAADAATRQIVTGVWVMSEDNAHRGEPRSSPVRAEVERPSPEVTIHFPPGGELSGIQALADEARRGTEAAVALLAEVSASEPDGIVRAQAVAALERLRGPKVEAALTAALDDADASVRLRAVRGLRVAGTETAVQSLAAVLLGDADPQVRLAALSALTSLPGRTMLQGLSRAVADPDGRVREAAVRGLAWWNTPKTGAP